MLNNGAQPWQSADANRLSGRHLHLAGCIRGRRFLIVWELMAVGGSTAAGDSPIGGGVGVPFVLRKSAQPMRGSRIQAGRVQRPRWLAAANPAPKRCDQSIRIGFDCEVAEGCYQDEGQDEAQARRVLESKHGPSCSAGLEAE